MKYYRIGEDNIPSIGLGTWKSKKGEVYNAVRSAIRNGYRHIDCAAIYQNENEVGKAIQDEISDGNIERQDLWITSKLWNNRHKKEDVVVGLQATLNDLNLEYLDLYLMHWPVAFKPNVEFAEKGEDFLSIDEVPLEETWSAMIELKASGMVKHIGVSNFTTAKLKKLKNSTGVLPEMNQVEMHPYLPQDDLMDFANEQNILLTAYSPLGSGDRPGKDKDQDVLLEDKTITDIAKVKNCSPAQVLLSWAITRGTIPIPKSVNPGRIIENINSTKVSLGENEMDRINSINKKIRYIDGSFFTMEGSPYSMEYLWNE